MEVHVPRDVESATRASFAAFGAAGFGVASWVARIPQVRDQLQLSPSQLGLLLLSMAVGSVLALPLSGPLIARFGTARVATATARTLAVAMLAMAAGYNVGAPLVAVGLFFFGWSFGALDVAINVHGALVERELGRSILARFHAGFSLGMVVGALLAATLLGLDVDVPIHLSGAGVVCAGTVVVASRSFLSDPHTASGSDSGSESAVGSDEMVGVGQRGHFAAWTERRTLLIGLVVLAFTFAEGVANDWIAVALVDDHQGSDVVGTIGLAIFLASMTFARWFGPGLLDRFGRVQILRATAGCGVVGAALFALAPNAHVALGGVVLWGVGASMGFPVGMSAGADEPEFAAGRVSAISSVGYCAFLSGPPLIGFLAEEFSISEAIYAVPIMLIVAVLVSSAAEPIGESGLD